MCDVTIPDRRRACVLVVCDSVSTRNSSVGKITKAMKMVAAAKLRGVQTMQQNSRPFAVGLQDFFKTMDEMEAVTKPDADARRQARSPRSLSPSPRIAACAVV